MSRSKKSVSEEPILVRVVPVHSGRPMDDGPRYALAKHGCTNGDARFLTKNCRWSKSWKHDNVIRFDMPFQAQSTLRSGISRPNRFKITS